MNEIHHGDCVEVMRGMDAESVDAIVTDPPAGIAFMGKAWDGDKGGRRQWIAWLTGIMQEGFRVLKPGGHALVWAIPRTSHWTATACEDAGFEIRDIVMHLFGSGFPKSLDVSKAIDKAAGVERKVVGENAEAVAKRNKRPTNATRCTKSAPESVGIISAPATDAAKEWDGWGTALKPGAEHWILCRKPLSEKTVAANVLKHGCGALNIDGARIRTGEAKPKTARGNSMGYHAGGCGCNRHNGSGTSHAQGRWPANVAHDGSPEVIAEFPAQAGGRWGKHNGQHPDSTFGGKGENQKDDIKTRVEAFTGDIGSAARFFYCAKASRAEREAGCEGMESRRVGVHADDSYRQPGERKANHTAPRPARNFHPTVKPLALMRWLCRLVTPPGGLILDPFAGSGSTGVAAAQEGFHFAGIEQDAEYCEIARARIAHAMGPLFAGAMT